jgi:uncharacterized C2H2 Zn-finger protein
MAEQTCPKCGTSFPLADGWAKAAVSLTIQAPAVRDMATQVRCPHCGYVFADSETRYLQPPRLRVLGILLVVAVIALMAWAFV